LIIREATISDVDQIRSLFKSAIERTCDKDYNLDQIQAWTRSAEDKAKWERLVEDEYFLVGEKEAITGFSSLRGSDYINMMYVSPDEQGNGIAKKLLNAISDKALEMGAKELNSDVSETARPFFQKQGYEMVKKNELLLQGVSLFNYRMKKTIS